MKFSAKKALFLSFCVLLISALALAQSRRSAKDTSGDGGTLLNVVATRASGSSEQIKAENLFLYENGIEQKIKNFTFDPSPSRIVVLVDNSQTLRAEVETLKNAVKEFVYEIYEGDQVFVVAYDEKPEIIQEWTDDAKKVETSLSTFRKQGNPYLFDALDATVREILLPLMPGTRKTAIVLISDGLDRGSKTAFDKILAELQSDNITVYSLQLPDRTNGAYRRNQPKAAQVITELTEGTGGKIFDFEQSQVAAKAICDELRKNRYLLSYFPANASSFDARRVFLLGQEGITVRTKNAHPPNVK
ncbi:MAG TPA: VWA domain-containing protein [Pyrinomonadaceae bacterium]|jgi:Ca-activated chloride channel family protein